MATPAAAIAAEFDCELTLAHDIGGPRLLTTNDLAALYGITAHTVRTYVEIGVLPEPLPIESNPRARIWNAVDLPSRRQLERRRPPRGCKSHHKNRSAEPAGLK